MIRSAAQIGLVMTIACNSSTTSTSPAPAPATATTAKDPVKPAASSSIERADLAFKGRVVSLGVAPNAWSGVLAIYQPVTWRVERVYRGDAALAGTELVVRHVLVAGSRTAQASPPGLNPTMFAVESEWIVLATTVGGPPTCLSENDGIVAPSAEVEAALSAK